MILEFVLNAIAAVFTAAVNLLPASNWSPDASGIDGVVGQVKALNSVLPIDTAIALFAVAVFFSQTTLGWAIVLWIYQHLPFVHGGGD